MNDKSSTISLILGVSVLGVFLLIWFSDTLTGFGGLNILNVLVDALFWVLPLMAMVIVGLIYGFKAIKTNVSGYVGLSLCLLELFIIVVWAFGILTQGLSAGL